MKFTNVFTIQVIHKIEIITDFRSAGGDAFVILYMWNYGHRSLRRLTDPMDDQSYFIFFAVFHIIPALTCIFSSFFHPQLILAHFDLNFNKKKCTEDKVENPIIILDFSVRWKLCKYEWIWFETVFPYQWLLCWWLFQTNRRRKSSTQTMVRFESLFRIRFRHKQVTTINKTWK